MFGDVTAGIDAHPLPVIVSIGGACTGRVLGLALLADIRIASRAATVNLPPIREALRDGLVASVTRVVGPSVAGYLVLPTATVRAEQAVMWGLFHEVVEPGRVAERAAEVARVRSARSPSGAPLRERGCLAWSRPAIAGQRSISKPTCTACCSRPRIVARVWRRILSTGSRGSEASNHSTQSWRVEMGDATFDEGCDDLGVLRPPSGPVAAYDGEVGPCARCDVACTGRTDPGSGDPRVETDGLHQAQPIVGSQGRSRRSLSGDRGANAPDNGRITDRRVRARHERDAGGRASRRSGGGGCGAGRRDTHLRGRR